ncbi:hypothetical protein CIB48_g8165 [Xylaria polymorpha]|nr:hypothetical protein CIB48_g8165 [Xylaria polymorpha]
MAVVWMRLIHIPTMVIHKYQREEVPPYAILSHIWNEEEVSFNDFQDGKGPSLKGYQKICSCCRQAVSDGLDAIWIDTCYIDIRSSAEISEPINSMFKCSMPIPSRRGNSVIIPAVLLATASRGNIAVLDCQPSDNDELRVGLYIEEQQESGSYIRVDYQAGIALIPLQEAIEKAIPTSTHTNAQKPCVLEYTNPEGHAFVLVLQKHVALDKVTGLEGFVLENTEMAKVETAVRAQVDDAIYNFQRHGVSANQTSSNRLLSIVPKIIEARHASIVNVEARRVTSSTVKRERHLRV